MHHTDEQSFGRHKERMLTLQKKVLMYGGYGKLNLLLSRLSYQSMAYFLPNISMFASCSPFLCCTYQADKSGPGKNRYQKN
jgi:hypothetical protein